MPRFPSFSQWKQIFKILNKKEKLLLGLFLSGTIGSLLFLIFAFYLENTKIAPAFKGSYVEGIVGQPRFINPIYGQTSDVDRVLINLIFSGLITYDNQGRLVKDLAKEYKISDDGKTYDFQLKDNIFWHDGKLLDADDVIFTVQTIQNSDFKSPLRANWIDVQAQKTSQTSVRFTLKSPYNSFLETLTLEIIPKHIWSKIAPENFSFSPYNIQSIGSGPFQFESVDQREDGFVKSVKLASNRRYHSQASYLAVISFQFFETKEGLIRAAQSGEIDGFAFIEADNNGEDISKEISKKWQIYSFSMPRYIAVFFNNSKLGGSLTDGQKASIFSDNNVRKALSYSINKDELIEKIKSRGKINAVKVDSPILPDFFEYEPPKNTINFDTERAKELLDQAGFKDNGRNQREKVLDKKPAFQFNSYLKAGSEGKEVSKVQECLARLDGNFGKLLQGENTNDKYGSGTEQAVTEFQKKYLLNLNPTGETGSATRAKLNELCAPSSNAQAMKFTLSTVSQPQLMQVAAILKDYWQSIGVQIDINAVNLAELRSIIKNRSYDALLYGESLGAEPDLYPFWHSSQRIDPGLNLSLYENKSADQLLKEAREATDTNSKKEKYEKLQDIIIDDNPASFLYNPDFTYWVSEKIRGINTKIIIDPAERFTDVTNWYTNTKRVWK